MVANTGTYLDTPFHRFGDGHDLAGLDLARVVGVPGILIDATAVPEAGPELLDGLDVRGPRGAVPHWVGRPLGDRSLRRP